MSKLDGIFKGLGLGIPFNNPNSQNPDQSKGSSILSRMTNDGRSNDEFLNLLNSLGINGQDVWKGERIYDWNKQLLDQLLAYYAEQEKRRYNEQIWNRDNLYNNPTNQIARLMGAGLSRDAAIALLGSGGSGSAGGDGMTDGMQVAPGVASSQSHASDVQNQLGIANAVFNGVSAAASLVGLGFSASAAIQQAKFLRNTNMLNTAQNNAYFASGKAYQILSSIGAGAEVFSSLGSVVSTLQKAADDGNTDAANFLSSPDLHSLQALPEFSSQTIGSFYENEHKAESVDKFLKRQELENALTEASITKLSAEASNISKDTELKESQMSLIANQIIEGNARIYLLNKQGDYQLIENKYAERLFKSQLRINDATADELDMSNNITRSTMPSLKEYAHNKLDNLNKELAFINESDLIEKRVKTWCQNEENALLAAYMENIYLNAENGFASKYPAYYSIARILHNYGISNYIRLGEDSFTWYQKNNLPARVQNDVTDLINSLK